MVGLVQGLTRLGRKDLFPEKFFSLVDVDAGEGELPRQLREPVKSGKRRFLRTSLEEAPNRQRKLFRRQVDDLSNFCVVGEILVDGFS